MHALAARVVSIVRGVHRLPSRHRDRGQRAGREVADAREIARRQAATHLGDGAPVRSLEEDGAAIGLEQDHRVVDEARQDAIEVEATADVAGDPMERLRPMQLVGDLVATPRDRDDRADGVGDDRRHVAVAGLQVPGDVADDVQHAPGAAQRRDDDREFGTLAGQDREGRAEPVAAGRGPAAALVGRVVGIGGGRQRGTQHAERPGTVDESLRPGVPGPRHRERDEAVVAQLPDRDEIVVVGVADEGGRPGEVLVEVVGLAGQSGDRIDEGQVDGVPLDGERVGRRPRRLRCPAIRDWPEQRDRRAGRRGRAAPPRRSDPRPRTRPPRGIAAGPRAGIDGRRAG